MNAVTMIEAAPRMRGTPMPHHATELPAADHESGRLGVFGPLEWLVIAIGQRDGPSSERSRPLVEALDRLLGLRQRTPLADPGLEGLRRMAALASEWGWQVAPGEKVAFLRAGWTAEQLACLIGAVAPSRCGDAAF